MKKTKTIFILEAFLISGIVILGSVNALTNVSECGIALDTPNEIYVLNQSVNSDGTCFTVEAGNITLDGAGYTITYSQVGIGFAINNSLGHNFTTIKNANMVQGGLDTDSHAIYYLSALNSTIQNNTITVLGDYSYGIYLDASINTSINDNNITASGFSSLSAYLSFTSNTILSSNNLTTYGNESGSIYVGDAISETIRDNTIIVQGFNDTWGAVYLVAVGSTNLFGNNIADFGQTGHGISISYSSSQNNAYDNDVITSGNNSHGIWLDTDFSNISNNRISTTGDQSNGMYISYSGLSTVSGNNITTSGNQGIGINLFASTNSNNLQNNNITTFGDYGSGLYLDKSNYNNISDNIITTTGTMAARGIWLDESNSSNISDNNISAAGYGIYIYTSSTSNTLSGNNITSLSSDGIRMLDTGSFNTIVGNTILSEGNGSSGVSLILYCDSNTISGNSITATGTGSKGLYILNSVLNTISNNIVSGTLYGSHLEGASLNALSNNTIESPLQGIYLNNASANNITGGVIRSTGGSYDYELKDIAEINNFIGTNFSSERKINFFWVTNTFKYNDQINGSIWLTTSKPNTISVTMTRIIYSWSNTSVKWNDTVSNTLDYSFLGLTENTTYYVDTRSNGTSANMYVLEADAFGALNFSLTLSGNTEVHVTSTDLIPPVITIQFPQNKSYSTQSIWFNITGNEAMNWSAYSLDGAENLTLENSSGNWNNNNASMAQGPHTVIFWANDTAGNMISSTVSFTIDATEPAIAITSPSNITYTTSSIWFNMTGNEILNWSGYSLDGAENITLDNTTGNWNKENSTVADGAHTAIFWANDSAGNINLTIVSFTIDSIGPAITVQSPINKSYGTQSIWFNITGNEAMNWSAYSLDGSENITLENSSGNWWAQNTSMAEGFHTAVFWANDSAGNMNSTEISFNIDRTEPLITIQSPINTTYTTRTIDFNITGSEILNWSGYALDGGEDIVSMANESGKWWAQNTSMADGSHTVVFYANDSAGNVNSTNISFIVHTIPPTINLTNPTNGSTLATGTTSAWINITTDENATCRYSTNSSFDYANGTNFTNTGEVNHSFNYFGLSEGTNNLYYKCNDSYGNVNSPAILHKLIVASAVPAASTNSPSSSSGGGVGESTTTKTITATPSELITNIRVNFKSSISNPSITAKIIESVPVPSPSGTIYNYVNITKNNFNNSQIDNATIDFKVNKSWIAQNNITTVYLARYENGWTTLRTDSINSTLLTNQYRAYTDAFSYFAIIGETIAEKTPEPVSSPQQPEIEQKQIAQNVPKTTNDQKPEKIHVKDSYLNYGIGAIVVIICIYWAIIKTNGSKTGNLPKTIYSELPKRSGRQSSNFYAIENNAAFKIAAPNNIKDIPEPLKNMVDHESAVSKKSESDEIERRLDELKKKIRS